MGAGKCRLHGGATPIKHGLNSQLSYTRLHEKIERFKQVKEPLDLFTEVAQLRALAEDLMERWETIYGVDGALLAWHESFKLGFVTEQKPRVLPDFSAIGTIVDKVGALVDRIHRHKAQGSITVATLDRVVGQLGVEVVNAVNEIKLDGATSSKLLDAVERRWQAIRVEPERAGS